MYSVVQCRRCWIRYETRQSGIWGGSLSGLRVHRQTQGQGQPECERKNKRGVMALVVWQYSALVGITHEKISNGITCIFPSRCLKSHITASGHLWKLMTVAQSLSSNAHFFFLFFSSSFPFVVRFLLLHFNRRRHCLNVAFEANDYFKLLSCDKEPCHLATRGNLFDRHDTGRSVPHLKKKTFNCNYLFPLNDLKTH